MMREDLLKAVGAHGLWKACLRRAIETGMGEFASASVERADDCEFGRWLAHLPAGERGAHFERVRLVHANFHREAARVLALVENGDRAGADRATSPDSDFERCTAELTRAMLEWSRAA